MREDRQRRLTDSRFECSDIAFEQCQVRLDPVCNPTGQRQTVAPDRLDCQQCMAETAEAHAHDENHRQPERARQVRHGELRAK